MYLNGNCTICEIILAIIQSRLIAFSTITLLTTWISMTINIKCHFVDWLYICELFENFSNSIIELSAKQIKLVVEKRELPFIIYFRSAQTKMTEEINSKRSNFFKKIISILQDNLRGLYLVIRIEPLLSKLFYFAYSS